MKPYSNAVVTTATAMSAYFNGTIIVPFLGQKPALSEALTFCDEWHLISGTMSLAMASPIRVSLKNRREKDQK
jgi:hypothetical protein